MGKVFDEIDEPLAVWIERQHLFFVATAPLAVDGHVNVSPKGDLRWFRILGPRQVAYLDFVGSGAETIAHTRENGRIVLMFCSFEGPPKIVRLHGRGVPVQQGDAGFAAALAAFDITDEQRRAVRSVIEVSVTRVADSCGFVVPRMSYEGERDQLYRYADNRLRKEGPDAVRAYVSANNACSIDGLRGLDALVDGAVV